MDSTLVLQGNYSVVRKIFMIGKVLMNGCTLAFTYSALTYIYNQLLLLYENIFFRINLRTWSAMLVFTTLL
jgi:hypothetical protein